MKILIADDSCLLRDRIKSLLNGLNNVSLVYEANNGVDALQLIRDKKPDLVILDIRMTGMNGIEILKKIREEKMVVKVCMLTIYTYPQYEKRCLEEGADYFLSKTESFEQIEIIINDLFSETITHD
jgi:two-component system, NarL family, nitrate/nitrite response regulator NarL